LSNADRCRAAGYFRSLSSLRYNRFLGAMSELPQTQLDHFIHVGEPTASRDRDDADRWHRDHRRRARYAFDADTSSFEFGLSVDDRWQGHGIGSHCSKTSNAARQRSAPNGCSAIRCGSNDVMIGLARKSGFAFTNSPGDWKLVRFEKHIALAPQEIPARAGAGCPADRASGGGLRNLSSS